MNVASFSRHVFGLRSLKSYLTALFVLIAVLSVVYPSGKSVAAATFSSPVPPCPANLAGKFVIGWSEESGYAFEWYKFFGQHTFTAETLVLSFAIVPSDSGSTYVGLDEIGGRTGYGFSFSGGLVNGAVPYTAGVWNVVEVEFDFDAKQYVITVNNVASDLISFAYSNSNSVQALRVHIFGASEGAYAWFDSISSVKSLGSSSTVLLSETFDEGTIHPVFPGTIVPLEPIESYGIPAACTSVAALGVSPITLEFSAFAGSSDPDPQVIHISDNGVASLSWTAEENESWLSLSSTEGTTYAEVEVSVQTDGLSPGVHTGQISVNSEAAEQGSPQPVYVSLVVIPVTPPPDEPCPEGGARRVSLEDFGGIGTHFFTPADVLTFAFSVVPAPSGQTLVGLDDAEGRTGYQFYFYNGVVYGESHGNHFEDDVPIGTYNAGAWNTVQGHYDYSTLQYMVSVNGIEMGPFPFSFSDLDSVRAFRIHTDSSALFTWIDTLLLKRQGDETPLYGDTFDGGPLPEGYALPPTCSAPPDATLQVSPTELEFTAFEDSSNPPAQLISVAANGTDPLDWIAGESVEWLSLSGTEGTAPATVEVAVDTVGLRAGRHNGPITIISNGAQGSPQIVDVSLLVKPSTPFNLVAHPGFDNIRLRWNPSNDPDVASYRVWRTVGESGDFASIAVISDTTCLDYDLALSTNYCYYVTALRSDGTFSADSNVDCTVSGQVELWVPDVWAAHGQTRAIPLSVRNATGLRIAASDIWLNYDSSVIKVLDVSNAPLTADYTWTYAIASTETSSQVRISTYKTEPPTLYGEGAFFWLTVQIIGSAGDESPLDLQAFVEGIGGSTIYTPDDLFTPVPMQLCSGVFHVADGRDLGDLNGNMVVQAIDAYIALQGASEEFLPSAEQLLAGDVTGNGLIEAADASMILHYAVHGTWPTLPLSSMSLRRDGEIPVLISLDDASGRPGDIVQTVLRAENLSDWAGGEFAIAFDTEVISDIVAVEVTDLTSDFALEWHDSGVGLLHIALASDVSSNGSGALAVISFRIAPTAPNGTTPLALAEARLNDFTGRDFATSALQQAVVCHSGVISWRMNPIYLPIIFASSM
jgi:hypothetical protein